jgi:hypothetical protein
LYPAGACGSVIARSALLIPEWKNAGHESGGQLKHTKDDGEIQGTGPPQSPRKRERERYRRGTREIVVFKRLRHCNAHQDASASSERTTASLCRWLLEITLVRLCSGIFPAHPCRAEPRGSRASQLTPPRVVHCPLSSGKRGEKKSQHMLYIMLLITPFPSMKGRDGPSASMMADEIPSRSTLAEARLTER